MKKLRMTLAASMLLFLTAICVTNPKQDKQRVQRSIPYISAIAAVLSCILFYGQKELPSCGSTGH